MPLQVGPTVNTWVTIDSTRVKADLQQIWPVQSLLCVQVFSQVEAHRPLQQSSPSAEVQSAEVAQAFGHLS